MTPERKQYLDNISKEERAIRQALAEEKGLISLCKNELNRICFYKRTATYKMLNTSKTRIKALKKQLPAPMKEEIFYNVKVFSCPICDAPLDVCVEDYCFKCGKKLR